MANRALVVTFGGLLLLLAPAPAHSCECFALPALSKGARTEKPFVFEGKVVEIVQRHSQTTRTTSAGSSDDSQFTREVRFEIKRAWNGVTEKVMTLSSDLSSCHFGFEVDHTYVVFAWNDATGVPTTNQCSRTRESGQAADVLAHLGQGTVPK